MLAKWRGVNGISHMLAPAGDCPPLLIDARRVIRKLVAKVHFTIDELNDMSKRFAEHSDVILPAAARPPLRAASHDVENPFTICTCTGLWLPQQG